MKGLFILITVCVVLFFVWDHIIEPGVNFRGMDFLTGDMLVELENGKADTIFFLIGSGATALPMVTVEICAFIMRPASTIIQPVCTVGFIVNKIPFFTLNFSIVVTNKGARAHCIETAATD